MLHARGDVSGCSVPFSAFSWYAPRTWRCFCGLELCIRGIDVCSTHVEMFLSVTSLKSTASGMLHARGDVSARFTKDDPDYEYAPRTWRCFYQAQLEAKARGVCSTHVEMFLADEAFLIDSHRMLHARGDVSMRLWIDRHILVYAPRTWRCFFRVAPRTWSFFLFS